MAIVPLTSLTVDHLLKVANPADTLEDLCLLTVIDGNARRVIAPVFEPLQAVE